MNPSTPSTGLSYPVALNDANTRQLALGLAGALIAFVIVVQLIARLVLGVGWLLRGRPDFDSYQAAALAYEYLDGIVATHLAIGSLLAIVLLLYRWLHGRQPQWVCSVQPGMRWRYLLICLVIAAVVLNASMWLLRWGTQHWQQPQPDWLLFLCIIVVTSPVQAAAEEFFFRGYLLQAVGSMAQRAWVGVLFSAVVFAILHGSQNPALFAHRLGFGLIAGGLVYLTGGLEASIAAHVMNNVFAFGYAMFTGGVAALKATTTISWANAAADLAGFVVFAAAAVWLGRRMNLATRTAQGVSS